MGNPKAIRAIASANGANPISILVPCHRVIGSDHSLTGYGGGLSAKKFFIGIGITTSVNVMNRQETFPML